MSEIQKLALLGGSGALGRDLKVQLESLGYQVEVLSRNSTPDRRSYKDFSPFGFTTVVNLIGGHKSGLSEDEVERVVRLSKSILQNCVNYDVTYVHLSSGIAGQAPVEKPGDGIYQRLKLRLEEVHEHARLQGYPVADLRLFSFAGSHALRSSGYFLAALRDSILSGQEFTLRGRGFLRDFSGPAELAMAISMVHNQKLYGLYELQSAAAVSRAQIIDALTKQFSLKVSEIDYEEGEDLYLANRSRWLPEFQPRTSLDVVLQEISNSLAFPN